MPVAFSHAPDIYRDDNRFSKCIKESNLRQIFKDTLEPFSYLIYAVSFFILLNKGFPRIKKILLIYYLISIPLISVGVFTKNMIVNHVVYNLFFFITICVLSFYFKSVVFEKTRRSIINIVLFINVVLFAIYDLINGGISDINTFSYAVTYLSILIYALLYFEHLIRNVNELNLLLQFDFYLVSGYLLYFFSCFFIILFYDNVEIEERALLWSLQNIILFLSSMLTISGSLWIHHRKKFI